MFHNSKVPNAVKSFSKSLRESAFPEVLVEVV